MAKFLAIVLICDLLVAFAAHAAPKGAQEPSLQKNAGGILIVGGENATEGELPYQLSLRVGNFHFCGGSIIIVNGTQYAITAAHCVDEGGRRARYNIVAGDLRLSDNTGHEQIRRNTDVIIHEHFDRQTAFNDIALLPLNRPFNITEFVQPIPLPSRFQNTTGEVLVSGWGRLSWIGPSPDVLQKVKLPVIDDETCNKAHASRGNRVISSMLCAGLIDNGDKSACRGDSGGPVVSVSGGYLAGLVSWGIPGCAVQGYPNVNTEVSHFIDWIETKVSGL